MISIQTLFENTETYGMHKKYLKKVSKTCQRLGSIEKLIPRMDYPKPGTERFSEDLEEVKDVLRHPVLQVNF